MYVKENKKKQIFSRRSDIKRLDLDVSPEYISEDLSFDEEIESGVSYKTQQILLRIPIDKVSAIKNDITHISGYVCRDLGVLNSRSSMLDHIDVTQATSINFAIMNKEILARESMQKKEQIAGKFKIFDVDISSSLLSGVKSKDVTDGNKNLSEIFDREEVLEVSSTSQIPTSFAKNFNRIGGNVFAIRSTTKATKEISPMFLFEKKRKQKLKKESITQINFKKTFNGYLRQGIDPAAIISKSNYSSQSLNQSIKGRLQKNYSSTDDTDNIAIKFHKMVEALIPRSTRHPTIKRSLVLKTHEVVNRVVTITDKILAKLGTENFNIICYAKDRSGRFVDTFTLNISMSKLKNRKQLIDKCKFISDSQYSFMCQRSIGNKAIVKARNNTPIGATYSVMKAELNQSSLRNFYYFKNFTERLVFPNSFAYLSMNNTGKRLNYNSSYFYRMKVATDERSFDNTFFDYIKYSQNRISGVENYVNIFCSREPDGTFSSRNDYVKITVSALPVGAIALNVVRRNLTKKEKEFKIIKNMQQIKINLPSRDRAFGSPLLVRNRVNQFDLKEQAPVFFNRREALSQSRPPFTFIDEDVESGDVYEYKVLIYDNNCVTSMSANSNTIQYQRKSNIVRTIMTVGEVPGITSHDSKPLISLNFDVSINTNSIDELFNSLNRNTYETFSEEFDSIKQSLKKNISCIVNLINKSTGEKTEIGKKLVRPGSTSFSVIAKIEDPYADYGIELIPRVATISYSIENLLNKIATLPNVERSMPISPFLRTHRLLRRNASKTVSSVPISKYASRSIRFFGLILDPVTKFQQEQDDFYYEGETGDNYYGDVYSPKHYSKEVELSFYSFSDLTHVRKNSRKPVVYEKLGIVSMKTKDLQTQSVSFFAMYAKSNGSTTFLGMISPDTFEKNSYDFVIDLSEEVGLVDIYSVSVLKDGKVLNPSFITTLLCNRRNMVV